MGIAPVEGGIRIGKKVYLGQSDITTATNKVSLKSKWVVTLPWWWLSNLQERTEPWAPISLKPFWTIGWSHTRAGFMRSSFTNKERDDGTVNQHHNLWVIHLCDLAYLFPFMFREEQEELATRLNKNDQQKWQMDFITADMMWSKLDKADAEAKSQMNPSKWMGMPICTRLGMEWRSLVTWHSYDLQIPRYRTHPRPTTQESTLGQKFQRRWNNDLQRWDDYQRGLADYATRDINSEEPQAGSVAESPKLAQPRQHVGKRKQFGRPAKKGSSPEFL